MIAARAVRATAPRLAASAARSSSLVAAHQSRAAAPALLHNSSSSGAGRLQSRSYAAEAKQPAAESTRPPIELFGVDGTYASALYIAAAKSSTLEPTATALSKLHQTFTKDPKLQSIMQAPTLTADDKNQLITELLKAAQVSESASSSKTLTNFLHTLASNNRLSVLDGVCVKFEELMSAARGEIELTVTSAEELDKKVLQRLETAVGKSRFVGTGRKLKVVTKVQPDIRGGLIVEIGDRTIDLSVSSKMARMNKLLQDTL